MTSRLERGLRILVLLQNGEPFDVIRLSNELGVSRRTIFRDMAMLKELGLHIEFDPEIATYCVQVMVSEPERQFRTLNRDELGGVLQLLKQEDESRTNSNVAIVRQIALLLTHSTTASAGQNPGAFDRVDQEHALGSITKVDGAGSSQHSIRQFATMPDRICFLCNAISEAKSLDVYRQADQTTHRIVPTEIKYTSKSWTLSAVTTSGEMTTIDFKDLNVLASDTKSIATGKNKNASHPNG